MANKLIIPKEGNALVIKNKEGNYYSGGSYGYWTDILNARQYSSSKGIRSILRWMSFSNDRERDELKIVEVTITEVRNHMCIGELLENTNEQ